MNENNAEQAQPKYWGPQKKKKILSPRCTFLLATIELQIKILLCAWQAPLRLAFLFELFCLTRTY